ncbi:DUF4241 domain-containing protein [Streptomyces qinzhouensis]|uniref:DUF4241 domain-containing protein n=1 Tax=Streptomyces qinzhouensis TaxID=2599401 RepID=UPI0016441160|nr:DUF4241 domain-containing protein [Streptomyces qinzhouensis]
MSVVVHEVTFVTAVRVPSGRLAVGCPFPGEEWLELAERIPSGVHRMEVAWTRAPYVFMDEAFEGRESAGCRLIIRDEPVAGWEMGLGVERQPGNMPAREVKEFGIDTGMGCFADAPSWESLTEPFRRFRETPFPRGPRDTISLPGGLEAVHEPATGADLVTVVAAEGVTTVWLGRTARGDIATVAVVPRVESVDPSTCIYPNPWE